MTRHPLRSTRPLIVRGLLVATLVAVLAPAVADAGTFEAYGPREFFRDSSLGPTESEFFFETFSVTQPALTYTIRVERIRATLVEVDINGVQVVKRRDFIDAGGDVVEKTVSLNDFNLLELEMQADPDGLVTISIFGSDDDPPTIFATRDPAPTSNGWNNTPVTVSFDCSDATSGIAVCPAPIYQDTETSGRLINAQAVDLAGNTAETSLTLRIDFGAPSVTIQLPTPGETVSTPTYPVTGLVSDTLSGIDTVTCNDEAASVGAGSFDCVVDLYLGGSIITVEATDLAGNTTIVQRSVNFVPPDVVKQLTDDTAPVVVIDHPADGSSVAVTAVTAEATITGRVVDLLQGFSQPEDVEVTIDVTAAVGVGTVTVDSAVAEVSNGSFSAADVRLRRGTNTITATATDSAGNVGTDSVTVDVQELSGQTLEEVSGDNQSAEAGTTLAEDLVVRLLDATGSRVSGRNVTFEVSRGSGTVDGARSATVTTDSSGEARVGFNLGKRAGAGNHQVTASATGFAGSVVFTASATPGAAIGVKAASTTDRVGQPSTALPEPLVVYAHDALGNPVPGTDVVFDVVDFADGLIALGSFTDGSPSASRTTGDDGRALVFFILGAGTERNDNAVSANLSGVTDPLDGTKPLPVTFKISPSDSNTTASVFGVVLDQNYDPVPNAILTLLASPIEDTDDDCTLSGATSALATSSVDGVFSFTLSTTDFTDQRVTLRVDGSIGGHGQLCLEVIPYTGRATNLGILHLPELQASVDASSGATYALDDLPGSSLTVAGATCDAGPPCNVSFTRLANDQLPAAPPRGRMPAVAWALMPLGVDFTAPAALEVPNTGDFAPGEVVDLWELDHDLAQFVRFGTATVSDDGSSITSDEGVGIRRSGIGYVSSSLLESTWAFSCDDGNQCTCDSPDGNFFVDTVSCPIPGSGLSIDTMTPPFNNGLCYFQPLIGPCEDGLFCTTVDGAQPIGSNVDPPEGDGTYRFDGCSGGGCVGVEVPDVDPTSGASARLEIDLGDLAEVIEKLRKTKEIAEKASDTGAPCEIDGPDLVPNLKVELRERCCESELDIVNVYKYTPEIQASIGVKCRLAGYKIKGLIEIAGNIGVTVNGKLQAEFEDSLCSDDDCFYVLTGTLEVEPFGEIEIEVLSGAAGASAKIAYPAGISVSQTCSCEPDLFDFIRGAPMFPPGLGELSALGPFPLAIDPAGNCGAATWELCAGPLRFEGRIKLLGFIKVGFDFEVDGTKFCTPL